MARVAGAFDSVVIGGEPNGLVAAITLAQRGSKVLLLEPAHELGGSLREIEFAPGFRAAPLAPDAGYIDPEVARVVGALPAVEATADPAVISLADGRVLHLGASVESTARGLTDFSAQDAQRWPEFAARMAALAEFLATLYREPAPRIDSDTTGELFSLARLGLRFRGLGTTNMVELLRTLPMALSDLLDDWFESSQLKGTLAALGVMDVAQGPVSGGTAFTFLHRHVGARRGVFSERLRFKGGNGPLVSALSARARSVGVQFEANARVQEVAIRDGRVIGVTLITGETISCRTVLSSLDPVRSLLELTDPVHLDPQFIHAVRNIRFRGVATKILVALDALPDVPGSSAPVAGAVVIAPSTRYVERAYDATKYGRCSDEPCIELRFPSVTQPSLAPAGKHVAVLHVQFTPYRLREGNWDAARDAVADRAFAIVEQHIPGFISRVRARQVLSPPDIESTFGLREGAPSQGEMMLDQLLFMRPVPGYSRYAMPVPGLFLCGAGTHPGAGATGLCGLLAARAAMAG
jgi:phytoene dehydrogenase-like protein